MLQSILPIKGRGSSDNPANRFEPFSYAPAVDGREEDRPSPLTRFFVDHSRTIVARNQSPDVGFNISINPYRGCEHGCIYCYARPTHEYLGFSAGLDFETKIMIKLDAAKLLRQELSKPGWQPGPLGFSGVTDCYQPIERKLQLTRQCLQVLAEFRHPVCMITKNHLVTRDVDVLQELAACQAVSVTLSITSLDPELARRMEPRASHPTARLAAVRELAQAGIRVGILIAPTIPGLNDHEVPAILAAAREAGAQAAGFVMLRLPFAIKDLFAQWLEQHYPERQEKVLGRIRSLRGGKLNDSNFATRMSGEGIWADVFQQQFAIHKKRLGYREDLPSLNASAFRRPACFQQRMLFD
jgi:DNA repair photolyase